MLGWLGVFRSQRDHPQELEKLGVDGYLLRGRRMSLQRAHKGAFQSQEMELGHLVYLCLSGPEK